MDVHDPCCNRLTLYLSALFLTEVSYFGIKETHSGFFSGRDENAALDVDQGNTQIRTLLSAEVHHGLRNRHFQGRLDQAGEEMATTERAIP